MSSHRYPLRTLTADYVRAGIGMALTFGPLAVIKTGPIASGVLAGLGCLFLLFALRTALRQMRRVGLSDRGIALGAAGQVTLRWADLEDVRLSFYPTRRSRSQGLMQLKLKGRGRSLRFDSQLEGFDLLVERAAEAAQVNGIDLGATTRANLAALGIALAQASGHIDHQ